MYPNSTIRLLAIWLLVAVAALPSLPSQAADDPSPDPEDDRPVVHLTFDSGPGPRTPEFLEVLDQWDAKATFFVIGINARNSPEMLAEIVEHGHALGNHTWSHRDLTQLPPLEALTELTTTNALVAEQVGRVMRCWRPPFGENSDELMAIAATAGLSNESWIPSGRWDVDTVDWKYGYEFVLERLQTVGPGDVVLMHGGMNPDPEDLAALMTWLEANGDAYRFETVPGCTPDTVAVDPPASLAATDPDTRYLTTDPDLWFDIKRGSAYLSAFGSAG